MIIINNYDISVINNYYMFIISNDYNIIIITKSTTKNPKTSSSPAAFPRLVQQPCRNATTSTSLSSHEQLTHGKQPWPMQTLAHFQTKLSSHKVFFGYIPS